MANNSYYSETKAKPETVLLSGGKMHLSIPIYQVRTKLEDIDIIIVRHLFV